MIPVSGLLHVLPAVLLAYLSSCLPLLLPACLRTRPFCLAVNLIRRCFTITPGISDQYIYRSLYGVQTYRCLRHMPRDQVMFIESDDLRDNPEEILPRVHRHIGE